MVAALANPLLAVAPLAPRESPVVETLPREQRLLWDRYVARRPDATLFHLHAWRDVAEQAYDLTTSFLVARDVPDGPLRGVLPLFRIPRPFSPYLTNGLFGAYGPVLADDDEYAQALLTAATQQIDRGKASYLHLKVLGALPPAPALEQRDVWVTAKLDLDASDEALFRRLTGPMRSKIRHAQRAGLTFHAGRRDLDGFYDVLSENMHRKGAPIYGRRFFSVLLEALGERAEVVTLRKDDQVISGALVAWMNGTAYVPFVSSRPSAFPLRANNLLYWEIARMSRGLGARTLDFGTSLRGSTALGFKESWKPVIEPVHSYLYTRSHDSPALEPSDSALARTAVRAFSSLPSSWAAVIGPRVCRWIA